jgi:hypothetical protein
MKLKHVISLVFMLLAPMLYANEVSNIVAVSADGDKTKYALADIKRIEVNATQTTASMDVILADGTKEGTYNKLLLAKDVTSIEEIGQVSLYVFPNPVSNTLHIQGVDDDALLWVYNLNGKCVLKANGTALDVTSLQQGTYILSVNNQFVKFIKK